MSDNDNNTTNIALHHNDARDSATESADLTRKIETLEHENRELTERVDELTADIDEWRREEAVVKEKFEQMTKQLEESEECRRALDFVSKRCVDLEGEVVRLQDEYVAAISDAEDATKRVKELEGEIEGLRKGNVELERNVRDYERKLGLLEMGVMEEKSKKLRVEEELRERVGSKDGEISELKKKVKELEGVLLKDSEKRIPEVKTADGVSGGAFGSAIEDGSKLNVLVVGSAGTVFIAAAAFVYLRYGRQS